MQNTDSMPGESSSRSCKRAKRAGGYLGIHTHRESPKDCEQESRGRQLSEEATKVWNLSVRLACAAAQSRGYPRSEMVTL